MSELHINTDDMRACAKSLNAGTQVFLSGVVYTARDAAHKRILEMIDGGFELPFELKGAVIYYAGPTPKKNDGRIGSFGPTTSSRMDRFSSKLLDFGVTAMIGKGERSNQVIESIKKNKAIYLCAIGGAGALASKCILKCDEIAFHDLGCESVKKLVLKDFPLIVGIDSTGTSVFDR